MTDFKKGNVVRMLSGGPKMTVVELGDYSGIGLGPENGAKCQWFEGTKLKEAVLDVEAIELYVQSPMGISVTRG